jgi:hypothetical protein
MERAVNGETVKVGSMVSLFTYAKAVRDLAGSRILGPGGRVGDPVA